MGGNDGRYISEKDKGGQESDFYSAMYYLHSRADHYTSAGCSRFDYTTGCAGDVRNGPPVHVYDVFSKWEQQLCLDPATYEPPSRLDFPFVASTSLSRRSARKGEPHRYALGHLRPRADASHPCGLLAGITGTASNSQRKLSPLP